MVIEELLPIEHVKWSMLRSLNCCTEENSDLRISNRIFQIFWSLWCHVKSKFAFTCLFGSSTVSCLTNFSTAHNPRISLICAGIAFVYINLDISFGSHLLYEYEYEMCGSVCSMKMNMKCVSWCFWFTCSVLNKLVDTSRTPSSGLGFVVSQNLAATSKVLLISSSLIKSLASIQGFHTSLLCWSYSYFVYQMFQ